MCASDDKSLEIEIEAMPLKKILTERILKIAFL